MTLAIALFIKFDSTFISLASSFKLGTTFQRSHPMQLQHFPLTQGSAHQLQDYQRHGTTENIRKGAQ